MSLNFCDYAGCTQFANHGYRRTKADILRYYCNKHARAMGFKIGEQPAESDYRENIEFHVTNPTEPKKPIKKRERKTYRILAFNDASEKVGDFKNAHEFAEAYGVSRRTVAAAVLRKHRVGGVYVKYAVGGAA
jgi:hypothetical protein